MDMPNKIILDLTDCRYIDELHLRIMEAFDFPSWYGANWDAFWDLIRGTRDNTLVEIYGVSSLSAALKAEVEEMIGILQENKEGMQKLKERCPDFDCRFDYRIVD
ncbi:MAG TPA: hypothetical protein DEP23_07675 [Ruminococcaceae bacterium]|jgi:RNAse (barnase) inhibitor barstar|nr:hypothetical protein [Oscillospiraceae bacterium]